MKRSFYHFPTDLNVAGRGLLLFHLGMLTAHHGSLVMVIAFVLIILFRKKSDVPSNPNYVPSVYPEEKEDGDDTSKGASFVARFERAQHRCKVALEQQRL